MVGKIKRCPILRSIKNKKNSKTWLRFIPLSKLAPVEDLLPGVEGGLEDWWLDGDGGPSLKTSASSQWICSSLWISSSKVSRLHGVVGRLGGVVGV